MDLKVLILDSGNREVACTEVTIISAYGEAHPAEVACRLALRYFALQYFEKQGKQE